MPKRSILLWGPFLAICVLGILIMITIDTQTRNNRSQVTANATDTVISTQEPTEDVADEPQDALENTEEPIADATDTLEDAGEADAEAVNDAIAEIASTEILEGEPPAEDMSAASPAGSSVDLGQQLQEAFSALSNALTSITDADSATAALPELESATATLSSTATLAKFLPEDARAALANFTNANSESIQNALGTANENADVADILAPSSETLLAAIAQLTE